MSAEELAAIAAAILTLAFSYVPGLNTKFAELGAEVKRLVMAGLLVLVAAGAMGIACAGAGEAFGVTLVCDQAGLYGLLRTLGIAIVVNQGLYAISPSTKAVREAKNGY